MKSQKKIYVIGHKNPDTDSIVSAIAYAELKQLKGEKTCFPARAGKINPQTEYILNRFNIPQPEFISDFIPKVRNHMSYDPITVHENTPLGNALEILSRKNLKMLPIVDSENKLISVLHYNAFAQNMLKKINPHKKSIIPTSVSHLIKALNAQPVIVKNSEQLFQSMLVVAASEIETVKEYVNAVPPENLIIIVGDRIDVQEYVIDKKIRCLIATGGKIVSKEIKDKAEKNGVSILISPFDTSTTSILTFYSTPVVQMGDTSISPVKPELYIKQIRELFSISTAKSLPVVNEKNIVTGVISQGDLMMDPNIEVIMVDHNELSQAVEGIDSYKILEIIDHHRLGNFHTTYPITFINKPVGSTSTIIASIYIDQKIPLKAETASILLAGILSDTLILRSATTTGIDKNIAEYLSGISGLEIDRFGRDIMDATSVSSNRTVDELLNMDLKKYIYKDIPYSISQIEVSSINEILDRKKSILEGLDSIQKNEKTLFSAIMITDITLLNSILLIRGDKEILKQIGYPKVEDDVYMLKDILSRKKQLMPYLTELVKKII